MNIYTRDASEVHSALMGGSIDDVDLIGNAVTALAAIVASRQKNN